MYRYIHKYILYIHTYINTYTNFIFISVRVCVCMYKQTTHTVSDHTHCLDTQVLRHNFSSARLRGIWLQGKHYNYLCLQYTS